MTSLSAACSTVAPLRVKFQDAADHSYPIVNNRNRGQQETSHESLKQGTTSNG